MKMTGARAIVRIARNPQCQLQTAMALERTNEPLFYRELLGRPYQGEYGERLASWRRGKKFEQNLCSVETRAALLRQAVSPLYGHDPELMVVRNFDFEVPAGEDAQSAIRRARTFKVFQDLAAGRPIPHLLIQPAIALQLASGFRVTIIPDYLVLDPGPGIYVPGDIKSFIVRDGVADKGDREPTRRQASVQIIALRMALQGLGLADRVTNRASFVFATHRGLAPAPAVEEFLDAEVRDTERALRVATQTQQRVQALRRNIDIPLQELADDLQVNYQESCIGTCMLVDYCKQRSARTARVLGDAAAEFAGDLDLDRLVALLHGATPVNAYESALADQLRADAELLGYSISKRRVA